MPRKLLLCLAASAALVACKGEQAAPVTAAPPAPAPTQAPTHAFDAQINAGDFGATGGIA